jgi:protein-tyrosine-phosphatase
MTCDDYSELLNGTVHPQMSKHIEVSLYDTNDLILTINDTQAFDILNAYPDLDGRVFSLSSYMAAKGLVMRGEDGRIASVSVNEPEGDDPDTYRHTVAALKAWIEILFPYIIKDLGARRFC